MKKSLMKIAMIAVLFFIPNQIFSKASHWDVNSRKNPKQVTYSNNISMNKRQLVHLHAMQNRENLKTYYLGAKIFNPYYSKPTENDFVKSIKSHPFFIGMLDSAPNHEEYVHLRNKIDYPFFIFETFHKGKSDFYMVHSKGVRHFIISTLHEGEDYVSSIDNGHKGYPGLKLFIKCTLKSC